jgi:hypothetical protein
MNRLGSSELSFAFLIACSVKATILLIFAWIAASAAHRRSAAFRHMVWAVGVLGSLFSPFCVSRILSPKTILPTIELFQFGSIHGYNSQEKGTVKCAA